MVCVLVVCRLIPCGSFEFDAGPCGAVHGLSHLCLPLVVLLQQSSLARCHRRLFVGEKEGERGVRLGAGAMGRGRKGPELGRGGGLASLRDVAVWPMC